MANELMVVPVADLQIIAQAMAKSGLFGFKTAEQALSLLLIAQAEGKHPASAALDYDIIENKPAKKPVAMMRDFIQSGGKVQWHKLDDTTADATFSHPSGGTQRFTWTLARAKQAGLTSKNNWQKYPLAMLRSRVVGEGVRTIFPGATGGLYTTDEVRDRDMGPERDMGTLEVVDSSTGEVGEHVLAWDPEHIEQAEACVKEGYAAYEKWWRAQDKAWRAATVKTEEHNKYKNLAADYDLGPGPVKEAA